MAKKKGKEQDLSNEILHDYIDCVKCGGEMLPIKELDEGKLYKCDDCKSEKIVPNGKPKEELEVKPEPEEKPEKKKKLFG